MALSDARQWWWNRTGIYYCTSVSDLPSFDAGSTFNPGDQAWNIAPAVGQPAFWVCLSGGTSPTWSAGPIVGSNATRISGAPATATTADRFLEVTAAGAVTIPAATTWPTGGMLTLLSTTGALTVTPTTGTINGGSNITIAANSATTLVSVGTNNWSSGV